MASPETVTPVSSKKGSHFPCCVPLCNPDARYDPSLHFHHIPKNEELRKKWILKIRRDEGSSFKITSSTVVCSKHFSNDDYSSWTPVRKRLKTDAIPSIFTWTEMKTPRRALKRKFLSPVKQIPSERDTESDYKECTHETTQDIASTSRGEGPSEIHTNQEEEIQKLRQSLDEKSEECDR